VKNEEKKRRKELGEQRPQVCSGPGPSPRGGGGSTVDEMSRTRKVSTGKKKKRGGKGGLPTRNSNVKRLRLN